MKFTNIRVELLGIYYWFYWTLCINVSILVWFAWVDAFVWMVWHKNTHTYTRARAHECQVLQIGRQFTHRWVLWFLVIGLRCNFEIHMRTKMDRMQTDNCLRSYANQHGSEVFIPKDCFKATFEIYHLNSEICRTGFSSLKTILKANVGIQIANVNAKTVLNFAKSREKSCERYECF